MSEDRRIREALERDLQKLDDMLAGLADEHSDFRSAEEIRGGIVAVRGKVREVWQRVATGQPARS